jgi:hypothetical protein
MLAVVEALVRPTPTRPLRVASATAHGTCPWPTVATHATVAASSGAPASNAACTHMAGCSAAHTADADCDRAGAR